MSHLIAGLLGGLLGYAVGLIRVQWRPRRSAPRVMGEVWLADDDPRRLHPWGLP